MSDIIAALALLVSAASAYFAYRANRKADELSKPVIEVEVWPLEPHWWTIHISARNRADYGIDGTTLECTSPRGGLLDTPRVEVVTEPDQLQVRDATSLERARRSIRCDIRLAPRGAPAPEEQPNQWPEFENDRMSAWLYLPSTDAQAITLRLTLRTREHTARTLRYTIKRSVGGFGATAAD